VSIAQDPEKSSILPHYDISEFIEVTHKPCIGSGSFGEVRKYDHNTLETVAIKRITLTGSAEAIHRISET